MNLPLIAEKVLPHRGKMLLIDHIISANGRTGTVTAKLPPESIAVSSKGRILSPFYIELVAQAYAAVCGYSYLLQRNPIPEGYLVGVQRFEIYQKNIPCTDHDLTISVETIGDFDGFAVVEGIISINSKILAEGKIKLFVPQEETVEQLTAQQNNIEDTIK
ncbi:3-hydroxylacyl-ACP dehydratase [Maridesulfovibrio zosterae]|uniref:3-hydroxylacyl-ACP dehydratase n=1 Tax=Maridesulfovibrio zosterae TaxID=82171 RepID=UPI00041F2E9A|nr:3-hydroxylacyl-ACP dehydratase [Maridesulfovibrio zosterae]